MINSNQLSRWNSGNITICKSRSHADMYIVEHGDGFHNLTASYDYMVQKYPPNAVRKKNPITKGIFALNKYKYERSN